MWDQAIQAFSRVVAENPQDASSHYHLGLNYRRRLLNDLAVGAFMKVLELDPTDAAAAEQLQNLQK